MFGKVIGIIDEVISIENLTKKVESAILGIHVIFEYNETKLVGEIVSMDTEVISILLIGEFINDKFVIGVVHKPNIASTIRVIYKNEVALLLGSQEIDDEKDFYIGESVQYRGFKISADINQFFSNHFAIIGNSGSGKSSSLCRILQNLFNRKNNVPVNANIILFDVYGEYHNVFRKFNEIPGISTNTLTTRLKFSEGMVVKIPPYYLEVDDLALLLQADSPSQMPILEKTLKYVYLFTEEEEKVIKHKNNIISKALLDILSSGRNPTQIRDQVIAVLSAYHTKDISLTSEIVQPGYIRTLRQCLNIDTTGKINTIQLVVEYLEPFVNEELELRDIGRPSFYTLKDIYNAFEFALLSEGILKVRLDTIINSQDHHFFEVDEYIPKDEFVSKLFTSPQGNKAQIVNINLNYIEERFAKVLTKVYSKMILDYAIQLENRGSFPIQIILEEAHRYVQNDNDINTIGYNIFDRITKEGRKYGVILGLISQRPSELSNTALSQCSNYLVFRMFHPDDLSIIKSITYSIAKENVTKLKTLRPGVGLGFGTAFKIPVFIDLEKPDPSPDSSNAEVKETWFKKQTYQ